MGVPQIIQSSWMTMTTRLETHGDFGIPHFRKPINIYIYIYVIVCIIYIYIYIYIMMLDDVGCIYVHTNIMFDVL